MEATRPERFFDVATGGPLQLQLEQEGDAFRVLRQIGYRDPDYDDVFVVPADPGSFTTDLASIPSFFAWLVPGMGSHLPAVLLHDGLVVRSDEHATHLGPPVDREEADRLLRDAMGSLGTPRLRRWLMWSAVSIATAWQALAPRWWWRAVVVLTVGVVAALGTVATLDLVDVADVLPWMGARRWWIELAGGAVFAVLVPLAASLLWRRLWAAGAIAGVALAFLLHVTVAVLVVYGTYWLAETVLSAPEGTGPDVHANLERASR